jgi:hypothetical protein
MLRVLIVSCKAFIKYFLLFLAAFIACNALLWCSFTRDLRKSDRPGRGDLARLGYISGIISFSEESPELPRRHLELEEYHGQPVDMITIGDSFSNGGGFGPNRYYQDYIASNSNLTVLNIEPFEDLDFVTQASLYVNNGFLDHAQPRYLLLSSTAKYCVARFSDDVDFDRTLSMAELASHKKYGFRQSLEQDSARIPENVFRFVNEGNFKFLLYNICYRFSDHAFFSKTYRLPLDRTFFSGNRGTTLLCYRDDIKNISYLTPDTVAKINENLNLLADRLAVKGVHLVFMPVVDKYDLYFEHIVMNRYPRNNFFDMLRPLKRRYRLIDTKEILGEAIRNGEKDIFYVDDTHWTWKASKKIFESVKFP